MGQPQGASQVPKHAARTGGDRLSRPGMHRSASRSPRTRLGNGRHRDDPRAAARGRPALRASSSFSDMRAHVSSDIDSPRANALWTARRDPVFDEVGDIHGPALPMVMRHSPSICRIPRGGSAAQFYNGPLDRPPAGDRSGRAPDDCRVIHDHPID